MHEQLKTAVNEFDKQYPALSSSKVIGCVINNKPVILLNSSAVGSKSVYVYSGQSKLFMVLDMNPEIANSISNDKSVADSIVLFKNGELYELKDLIKQLNEK